MTETITTSENKILQLERETAGTDPEMIATEMVKYHTLFSIIFLLISVMGYY